MTVSMILKRKGYNVVTAPPTLQVRELARLLTEANIGAVAVVAPDGFLLGVAGERDIVRGLARYGPDVLSEPIASLMDRDLAFCAPHDSLETLMQLMTARRVRHLPVLDHGELIGIVSIGDVVKERITLSELETQSLRAYIVGNA